MPAGASLTRYRSAKNNGFSGRPLSRKDPAPSFRVTDEIYVFRNFSPLHSHVLLSLDTSSVDMKKANPTRDHETSYPLAWTRTYGKGRVFYIALGHEKAVWRDPRYREILLKGIRWAISH